MLKRMIDMVEGGSGVVGARLVLRDLEGTWMDLGN